MPTRFVRMAALAVPLLAIAGCANMMRTPTYGLEPDGAALVRQACTDVMGIRTGFPEFDACADSLAQSVHAMNEVKLISQANAHCEREGFAADTAARAKCVVLAKEGQGESGSEGLAPMLTSQGLPRYSYWSASASQQNQRMELSCAHLGLHPGSVGFGQCVANLKNALLLLPNPL